MRSMYARSVCSYLFRPHTFRLFSLTLAVLLIAASPFSIRATAGGKKAEREKADGEVVAVADRLLVKPKKGIQPEKLKVAHDTMGSRVKHRFRRVGDLEVVELPAGKALAQAKKEYEDSGLVEYAEPDYIVQAHISPNDPAFANGTLWGLHNYGQAGGLTDADIDGPEAWDVQTDASSVIVAVIDTGVRYTHEDLEANMWTNPGEIPNNGVDDDANGYVDDVHGINAIVNNGNPMDDNGHGSHVAGTIGASGNNGLGVAGVAWQARIMACKFLNNGGTGSTSDAIKCIDYARSMGANVMNNSWGGGGFSQALRDAIAAARDAGIIFVASAGNAASNNDAVPSYPASYDVENIVSVAATDRSDLLASFSSYGPQSVELGAPGVSIYSCSYGSDSAYLTLNGTSMAAPHVSGAMALARARFPSDSFIDVIRRVLAATDAISSLSQTTITGGRLNLHRALTQDPIPYFDATPSRGLTPLSVTFNDGSVGTINTRVWDFGDGSPSSSETTPVHTYTGNGSYTASLTVAGPGGTYSRTRSIRVYTPVVYKLSLPQFQWIDPSSMSTLTLGDDSISAGQALPFPFRFYGENYTILYVGSNGLLGFEPGGLTKYLNTDLPDLGLPDTVICPYWDDLNPGAAGSVRIGTVGQAPNRTVVVSWVGVPHYLDGSTLATSFTFQALLREGSNDIVFQYLDVDPAHERGAGRSATVGIENQTGQLALKYSWNGSVLLSNGLALQFTPDDSNPPPDPGPGEGVLAVTPGDNLNSSGEWGGGPFLPSSQTYTLSNTGGSAISWTVTKSQSWVSLSATGGALAPGQSTTVTVSINSNADFLDVGTHGDTITFSNTSNRNGDTARTVSLVVISPPIININPSWQDYGGVAVGATADRSFTVRNFGGGTLVGTASVAAPFSVVSGGSYSIPAGQTTTVVVRFAPTQAGSYNEIVIFTGGGGVTAPVSGSASSSSIAVTPASRDFGSVPINQNTTQTFTVSNTGGTTLTGVATVTAPFSIASGANYTIAPGSSKTVTVRFSPTAQGTFMETVNFTGGGGATATVTGTGTVSLVAPGYLRTSVSGSTVTLTWNDTSGGESGFKIERRPQGFWSVWTEIGTAGPNATSYVDTGLARGTYQYRVRSYNGTAHSPYSNTASAKIR